MLAEGTLPPGYTVKKRRLVKVKDESGKDASRKGRSTGKGPGERRAA
jgi:hypothetical protein